MTDDARTPDAPQDPPPRSDPWQGSTRPLPEPPAPHAAHGGARVSIPRAAQYPPAAYPWYQPPYGQPPPYYAVPVAYAPQETDSSAVAAFVLSIAGWVVVPIIGPVVAVVMASSAKRRIRESAGRVGGQGLATAAQVISWLQLAPAALLVAVLLFVILPLAATS